MDTGVLFYLAHLIALSSTALLPDSSTQEVFCFHVKSELGRTQCSFLRRPSAEASVLFYWSIWTADDRVEECSISAEPAVLHNYRSVCNEQSMWDLHKTSPRNLNITGLFEPDSPCELQSVGRWNLRPQKYVDTDQKYVDTDQKYVDTDQKYVDTDQKYVDTDQKYVDTDQKYVDTDQKYVDTDQKYVDTDQKYVDTDQKYVDTDQKYVDTDQKYVDTDQKYVDTDQKYVDTDQKYVDTDYHVGSESRKRQKRAWIFPGTLWCGHGSRAGEYEQLGMFERVDRCCREHDHCDHIIRPFTVNFGVFNPTLFTISHCECDRRFKQCLVDINDTVSNMVGYTFFNILNQQCFELVQKRRCTKINWIGMCTTVTVAPFAVLKHTMMYNATTSNAGILEPLVYQGKPSTTIKPKNKKHKQRKQFQKGYAPVVPAAGHTCLLSEAIGKPKTTTSTTAQPNCMMSCNATLFHQKCKLVNRSTPFPAAAASTASMQTTPIASKKQKTTTSKKITPNKSKSKRKNKHIDITTVQSKLIKPLKTKVNSDPSRGDHFLPKQQRRKDSKQDKAFLYSTILPKLTLSLASKRPRTNKLFENVSQTKKDNVSRRKMTSNAVSSRSHPEKTKKSDMKHKSAVVTKLPMALNKTKPASETFQPTAICDVTKHLDECKARIHPMEKLYGHHNTERTTIYHCDCINRLTDHLKHLESIALLEKLLWKFVSMFCFETLKNKKCSNNTRCSAILFRATELKSSLIKLGGQVSVKNRKISANKRGSKQLYKRCIRILHPRSLNHVKHNA